MKQIKELSTDRQSELKKTPMKTSSLNVLIASESSQGLVLIALENSQGLVLIASESSQGLVLIALESSQGLVLIASENSQGLVLIALENSQVSENLCVCTCSPNRTLLAYTINKRR